MKSPCHYLRIGLGYLVYTMAIMVDTLKPGRSTRRPTSDEAAPISGESLDLADDARRALVATRPGWLGRQTRTRLHIAYREHEREPK